LRVPFALFRQVNVCALLCTFSACATDQMHRHQAHTKHINKRSTHTHIHTHTYTHTYIHTHTHTHTHTNPFSLRTLASLPSPPPSRPQAQQAAAAARLRRSRYLNQDDVTFALRKNPVRLARLAQHFSFKKKVRLNLSRARRNAPRPPPHALRLSHPSHLFISFLLFFVPLRRRRASPCTAAQSRAWLS